MQVNRAYLVAEESPPDYEPQILKYNDFQNAK